MKKKLHLLSAIALLGLSSTLIVGCDGNKQPVSSSPSSSEVSSETSSSVSSSEVNSESSSEVSSELPSEVSSEVSSEISSESSSEESLESSSIEEVKPVIEMNGTTYNTIKEALLAIPTSGTTDTYTINLDPGEYLENGLNYNGSATVRIVGKSSAQYGRDVVIKGRGSDMSKMRSRELLEIQGTGDVILENISLVSDYTRGIAGSNNAQAEVLGSDTKGNTFAYNCSFISHQDTLRTASKAWFYNCYVEGDTDFIWMEESGDVALYENCEIVSVYDVEATTHASYIAAPRMRVTEKAGKGVVFYNSTVKESEEAVANGQKTYLARSPWAEGYYNQVAYINTTCSDVELTVDSKAPDAPWYGSMIPTSYARTDIGWKMDSFTANSLGLQDKDYIIADDVTAKEYNGRKAILNRHYNTAKLSYEVDIDTWDVDALISTYAYDVTQDVSQNVLEGEVVTEATTYLFDGSEDVSSLVNGFAQDGTKPHFKGNAASTITVPVTGKSYVEVYGYYSGIAEVKAENQGEAVMFFNNGSTSKELSFTYTVYDDTTTNVVLTAQTTTYITKIVVVNDPSVPELTPVSSISITPDSDQEVVGVAVDLDAEVNLDATNKSVKWSSSDTTIADINTYTGEVTFKASGEVTFTATACDGSNVTATHTCNPVESSWTQSEWYTTDKTDIKTEAGAEGIENYNTNSSAYKDIKATYTFTNLAGQEISTAYGLKLNSSGKLSISTTKPATLTVITGAAGTTVYETPKVTAGAIAATCISSTANEDQTVTTYVYQLTEAGTWTIERGSTSAENRPIIYAKCVY